MTKLDHGCWAMRSTRLALAVSIQWRSSITSSAWPLAAAAATKSKNAPATSSPLRLGSTSPITASSGRPIDPGWAVTTIVVTVEGSDCTISRTSRVLPIPASPETNATAGCSDVITSAASTIPARRAKGRARPTMTGLIPTRPLNTTSTLEGPATTAIRRAAGRVRRDRAPGEAGGRRRTRPRSGSGGRSASRAR